MCIRFRTFHKKIGNIQAKFNEASRKLSASAQFFKQDLDDTKKGSFPVIQANGAIVEFAKVIDIWAKSAAEGENHPCRTYLCPVTNTLTNLVHPAVSTKLQGKSALRLSPRRPLMPPGAEIGTSLGVHFDPPVCFEYQSGSSKWTPFDTRHHYHLAAHLCYVYANRKNVTHTTCAALDDGAILVHFKLNKVMI